MLSLGHNASLALRLNWHLAERVVAYQEETQGETNHRRSVVGGCHLKQYRLLFAYLLG